MLGPPWDVLWLKGKTGISWAEFDPEWYLARYPDVGLVVSVNGPDTVLRFYLIHGQQMGHSPNRYFDEQWYLRQYPEVATAVNAGEFASGFDEYCRTGFAWRSPHWLYDDWLYRYFHGQTMGAALDEELLQLGGFANRYDHYLRKGSRAGVMASLLFDADYYREQLGSKERVEAEVLGAFSHYLQTIETDRPELHTTIYFNPHWYRQKYPNIAGTMGAGWLSALHHYLTNPTPTTFDPLPEFSETFYRQRQIDVVPAVDEGRSRNFYQHFLTNGVFELRAPHERIDLRAYIDEHVQVRRDIDAGVVRDAFAHLLRFGVRLGSRMPLDEEASAKALFRARARALLPVYARQPINFDTGCVPAVSVIMAMHDNFALTLQALASLRDNYSGVMELVLVDCGSTDETRFVERYVQGAQVLRFDANLGFVRACNAALMAVSADAVLFLNNDVELAPSALASALHRLRSDARVGAVGGKVIRSHGKLQEAGCIIWRDGTTLGYMRDAMPLAPEVNFVRDVDYCSAVFLLVRSAPLRELDGFDDAFAPAYYEDTDLCVRLHQAGYRIVYDPSVVVHHLEYGTSGDRLPIEQIRGNQRIFVEKRSEWLQAQHVQDTRAEIFARSSRRDARRLLFIDDTVPMRMIGSGFTRSNDLVRTMAELGWQVTVYPVEGREVDPAAAYVDFPDTVEVMYDRSLDQFEEFLKLRAGYYDTIWVARTHNLDRVIPILQRSFAAANPMPRCVLDTEAIAALRDAERMRLTDPTTAFDKDAAISREFSNAQFCQRLIAVNEWEAATLRKLALADVSVIGHMREIALTPRRWEDRSGLLFVGAIHVMDSPNYDSLCWFVDSVMPLIEQTLGWKARLTVVGYTGDGVSLERFSNHPRVSLLGAVTSTPHFYDTHRVFVAPTRYAAGLPYKVHEAASFGLPIVASELLRRQLGWENGRELLAADVTDPDAFARQIINLYESETLWSGIRIAAAERVRRENNPAHYSSLVGEILNEQVMSQPDRLGTAE
jgi:GT2 family glycosyltransferase